MKQATLFSFFAKSPATPRTLNVNGGASPAIPVKSIGLDNTVKARNNEATPKRKAEKSKVVSGTLVWAKLSSYPFWPAVAFPHPTQNVVVKKNKVNVQFFDNPPSRAWVDAKNVKPFTSKEDAEKFGFVIPDDPEWRRACEEAAALGGKSDEERLSIIVCTTGTDDENEGESPESSEPQKKRRRIIIESDEDIGGGDSEDEYKPPVDPNVEEESEATGSEPEDISDEPEDISEDESPIIKPKTAKSKSASSGFSTPKSNGSAKAKGTPTPRDMEKNNGGDPATPKTPSVGTGTLKRLSSFAKEESVDDEARSFVYLTYDFLKPEKVCDATGKRPDHPEYDRRTLKLPESFLEKQTPGMSQWWKLKAANFDTILFFKMGKFYELFHMDASIAVQELGIIYMKGEHAHAGFPETAFGRYSSALVEKGYKIARVEQTETPEMMAERLKTTRKPTKFDRVVTRELCQITTKGTRTFNVQDAEVCESTANYLLAVCEKELDGAGELARIGVAFIDTSIGQFHVGEFEDDRYRSRLRTLVAHYNTVQVLHERQNLSKATLHVLTSTIGQSALETLAQQKEFWEADKTLKYLAEGDYFNDSKESKGKTQWPEGLVPLLDEGSTLGLVPKRDAALGIRSLGALIWYLISCKLDQELLSMKNFVPYIPVDEVTEEKNKEELGRLMVLDSVTLKNLDVLENSALGGLEGTLIERLDRCSTPFGKRLFQQWICSPLCSISAIVQRQNAIDDLMKTQAINSDVKRLLKTLPDLERLVSKIHSQGHLGKSLTHPDSRAIFYEEATYSKKKIGGLLSVLNGFQSAQEIISLFEDSVDSFTSNLLKSILNLSANGGRFPDLEETLLHFDKAFDHSKAKKDGKVVPNRGADAEFDEVIDQIAEIQSELDAYLKEQQKHFGCKVTFTGSDKKRFQIEVPESAARRATGDHELQGSRKGFKRYWTPQAKDLLKAMMDAEDRKEDLLKDIARRLFERFDAHRRLWEAAIGCLAILDCLMSLVDYSTSGEGGEMCKPVLLGHSGRKPFLSIKEGRHPCLTQTATGGSFIPNSVVVGEQDGSSVDVLIITGPNMGGKSTLMRQVGLIVVLAQMGCYVPAESCQMTLVDRLFTRLGATDRIFMGESTFFVEMNETAAILKHATVHSLVLMDELGRGTATYDGTAIASAVVSELVRLGARSLFSTHYHVLVEEFHNQSNVGLGHMACMVENENDDDPTQETITFLYRFVPGACPKSYGFNAARLAGLEDDVIREAHRAAREFEKEITCVRAYRNMMTSDDESELVKAVNLMLSV